MFLRDIKIRNVNLHGSGVVVVEVEVASEPVSTVKRT